MLEVFYPPRSACRAGQPCKGFNLIEAAIVLGVVGLVLGGIWWAVGSIKENITVNRLFSATLVINSKMAKLFKGMTIPSGNVTGELIQAGVIPSDFKAADGANCWNGGAVGAVSPDDKDIFICIFGYPALATYTIEVVGMSLSQCIKYVSKINPRAPDGSLLNIELSDIHGFDWPPWALLPMSTDVITMECDDNIGQVRISYNLPR